MGETTSKPVNLPIKHELNQSPKTEKRTYWWTRVLCVIKCFPVHYNIFFPKTNIQLGQEFIFRTWETSRFPAIVANESVHVILVLTKFHTQVTSHLKVFHVSFTLWKLLPSKITHRTFLPSFLPFPSLFSQFFVVENFPLGSGSSIRYQSRGTRARRRKFRTKWRKRWRSKTMLPSCSTSQCQVP